MGNEKYFDENVVLYDKYRPTYVTELYSDIIKYANMRILPGNSNYLNITLHSNSKIPYNFSLNIKNKNHIPT